MQRSISILLAAAMAVGSGAASFVPAQAAMLQVAPAIQSPSAIIQVQDNSEWRYKRGRGDRHGWGHGNNWRGNNWHGDDRRWRHGRYRHGRDWDDGNGAGIALGMFGFAAGAILGSQVYGGGGFDNHDAACARRFRSYDPYSNTYMGYDGHRHYC